MPTRRSVRTRLGFEVLESRLALSSMASLPGSPLAPLPDPLASSAATISTTSPNYAGYHVATNLNAPTNNVTAVGGGWTVPKIRSVAPNEAAAEWVGLATNGVSIEQIGTVEYTAAGATGGVSDFYRVWYEMYPAPPVYLDTINPAYRIRPGDKISASVTYNGSATNTFDMKVTDSGSTSHAGWKFENKSVALPGGTAPGLSLAEWIVEDPGTGVNTYAPFGNFGTVSFFGADATINGQTGPINDPAWQNQQYNMTLKATTSALTPAGTAFTVTYANAASATNPSLSGYQVMTDLIQPASNLITAVSGDWTVPRVSAVGGVWGSEVSEFVGMDSPSSNPSLSAGEWVGTAEYINSETGQPGYAAWYEIYPGTSGAVEITGMTIHAGDTMSGHVTYSSSSGAFTLTIKDTTTGQDYSTTQTNAGAPRWTAEWMVSDPYLYLNGPLLPLPSFTPVTFSDASVKFNGSKGPIAYPGWHNLKITMVSNGVTEDSVSRLNKAGSGFTVTYLASAAAASVSSLSSVDSPAGADFAGLLTLPSSGLTMLTASDAVVVYNFTGTAQPDSASGDRNRDAALFSLFI